MRPATELAAHYSRFRVAERILLTGHSHQAWPDVARDAQLAAFDDAAEHVDGKWARAEQVAERVRVGFRQWLGDTPEHGTITLAQNTHEVLVRLLSALPLRTRPRILTTDGEFHSARRQFDRLAEEGIEVVRVAAAPVASLAARLADQITPDTALVLVSKVLFATGEVVPGLAEIAAACRAVAVPLCVDTYHALGPLDWRLADDDLADAFVVGGGYKYLQLGEGNCFLRWPAGCDLRPVVTGWYAEFGDLDVEPTDGAVGYGSGPERFAGATYDPTSHHRAAAVMDFFEAEAMTPASLRIRYRHQVGLLADRFDALELHRTVVDRNRAVDFDLVGGFLALHSSVAGQLRSALVDAGVACDHRGDILRLGPAPYVTDDQLDEAVATLGRLVRGR